MVEECVHILATGQKCRRLPKRGQKYCTAHHPSRRRQPWDENQAFHKEIVAWIDRLDALALTDLLNETLGALAAIHPTIDRRWSRRNRVLFCRASAAITLTRDRIHTASHAQAANSHIRPAQNPLPSQPPAIPPTTAVLSQVQRGQLQAALENLETTPNLPPEQLNDLCSSLLTTLDPDN